MIDRQALSDAAFRYGVAIELRRDVCRYCWVVDWEELDTGRCRRRVVPDMNLLNMRFPGLATDSMIGIFLTWRFEERAWCSSQA